jgi:hypothetical protein
MPDRSGTENFAYGRYPGYDVLAKRNTPSWNEQTRQVIDRRLATPYESRFLNEHEWLTLEAVSGRIIPQPTCRSPVPIAGLVDGKLLENAGDGYRNASMPLLREAWRRGLAALDAEADRTHGMPFHRLTLRQMDALLTRAQQGELRCEAWGGMPCDMFFKERLLHDIVQAYYSHPSSWNEIGWGGPASPRGYVRMGFDRRDPWEAAEVQDGDVERAFRENRHVR